MVAPLSSKEARANPTRPWVVFGFVVMALILSADHAQAVTCASATKTVTAGGDHPFYDSADEPGPFPVPACACLHWFVNHRDTADCPQDNGSNYPESQGEGSAWWDEDTGLYYTQWIKNTGERCGTYRVRSSWACGSCPQAMGNVVYVTYGVDCAPPCVANKGQACTHPTATNACGMPATGTIQCDGTCGALTYPPNSACPSGTAQGVACGLIGTASDPNRSPTNVRIYNGLPTAGGTLLDTIPSAGAWSWSIPQSLRNGQTLQLYAYVQNLSAGGAQEGPWWPLSPAPGSPIPVACDAMPVGSLNATCGTVSGSVTDVGFPSVNVRVYDGPAAGTPLATPTANPVFNAAFTPFTDGAIHTLYAYALNLPGSAPWYLFDTRPVSCPAGQPTVIDLDTPADYCVSGPTATVYWSSATQPQTAYQLQVATDPGFGSVVYDSLKTSQPVAEMDPPWYVRALSALGLLERATAATSSQATVPLGALGYNATYYVRVRVWGSADIPSIWSATTPITQFSTPIMAYPTVQLSWTPQSVFAKEPIQFTGTAAPNITSWLWDFGDGAPPSPEHVKQNPSYAFPAEGSYSVKLSATNAAGTCFRTLPLNAGKPIPELREVRPGRQQSPAQ